MNPQSHPAEGTRRERLAAYFLAAPPMAEQTPTQRKEYMEKLHELGRIERQELCQAAGGARPLVWGNPATLIQALLSAVQRLAAKLGQPILIFPARETAIGADTLLHPRLLSIALCDLLCHACTAAPRQPVWVRLQERTGGLTVAITTSADFVDDTTLSLIKECTKLHEGSLVHCEQTIVFSCGQVEEPPAGVRLYCCPTEEELLSDTLSPVWSIFYAGLYASSSSSKPPMRSSSVALPMDHSTASGSSSSDLGSGNGADKL